MKPYRILQIVGGPMHFGGAETMIMNYYRLINKEKIQFDFVIHGSNNGQYAEEILKMDGRIYNIPLKSVDFRGNLMGLRKILNSGEYKVIHSHMEAMGMIVLREAKKAKINVRISHSHSTQIPDVSFLMKFVYEYARRNVVKYATHLCACSKPAAVWLYGEKNADKTFILKNAIDVGKFVLDEIARKKVRDEFGIGTNLVVGHIARFSPEKNHMFCLEMFSELLAIRKNAILLLIGEGKLHDDIVEKINQLGISDRVILTGARGDISALLQAMDVLVLPSFFEGLGIVVVEGQASGVPCIVSDKVPLEAKLTDLVDYLSIDRTQKLWAETIVKKEHLSQRILGNQIVTASEFNIANQAHKLEDFYFELCKKEYD